MIQTYDIPFHRNSIEHKVLHLLRDQNLATQQMTKLLGRTSKGAENLRLIVTELSRKKFVVSVGFDMWQLTENGRDACIVLGGEPTPKQRNSRPVANLFLRGNYDGAELGQAVLALHDELGEPAHVLDGRALGQLDHPFGHGVDEVAVVGHEQDRPAVGGERRLEPGHRVGVEVVGRLVEHQEVWRIVQHPRHCQP